MGEKNRNVDMKRWRKENPEKVKKSQREYYRKNAERIKANRRAQYVPSNCASIEKWRKLIAFHEKKIVEIRKRIEELNDNNGHENMTILPPGNGHRTELI